MNAKISNFINREISWIEFNHRVLQEAQDQSIPALERLRFLAITASNLDEFFMVRIGSLKIFINENISDLDASGLTPKEQLSLINVLINKMVNDQYRCFLDYIEPLLEENKIKRLKPDNINPLQLQFVETFFENEIFPILTPIAVHSKEHLPLLSNLGMFVIVRLKPEKNSLNPRFAFIPISSILERIIRLPTETGFSYILIEDVIKMYISKFFHGEQVMECGIFRITRNADLAVRDEDVYDFLSEMEEIIEARKISDFIRLEIEEHFSKILLNFLHKFLKINESETFIISGPINLAIYHKIANLENFDHLKYETYTPIMPSEIDVKEDMFSIIKNKDLLLIHPYESFDPVVRFIQEASDDPNVLAIKQILYRTSKSSPIVAALAKAAEKGKYVTVVVELKARFDEERNIEWAKKLEQTGVQVIYGVKGLKTHAKICIIIRKEPQGIVRYMHFGTGNYNEITAKVYSDVSYLTCNEDLGQDATAFFNAITGYSQPQNLLKINFAPIGLREKVLELINSEIERKKQGSKALIMVKINSLVDTEVINALYNASNAGVKILLNVRGICCLKPNVKNLSENITVVSIVDRFLEHSRILYFYQDGKEKVFISSADWMPRNLDKRIELLVPVENELCRKRLINILNCYFLDNVKSRKLLPEGSYERLIPKGKKKPYRVQEELYKNITEIVELEKKLKKTVFEPHVSHS